MPITQEIPRIFEGWCQEPRTKTKYIFYYAIVMYHILAFIMVIWGQAFLSPPGAILSPSSHHTAVTAATIGDPLCAGASVWRFPNTAI